MADIRHYVDGVTNATTHDELMAHLRAWADEAPDALEAAPSPAEFDWFRQGVQQEREGNWSGDEWAERYGPVLIPEKLLRQAMAVERG